MKKGAQQEIAGFVIIVVLVVVAVFIFMIVSLGNRDAKNESLEVGSLLDALLAQTTECVVREPLPTNIGELIQEANGGALNCKNLDVSTKEYLISEINKSMTNVMKIDRRFVAWQIDVLFVGEDESPLQRFYYGNCNNGQTAQDFRDVGDFRVLMTICLDGDN